MSDSFVIDPQWEPSRHGPEEIRQTTALLHITVNGQPVTRVFNDWTQSVHESVRVSTYPLALWLASSWWRLLWEPMPAVGKPDSDWRMAHEVGGAGHGYLWPPLRMESDGNRVRIQCTPSPANTSEPIQYLTKLHETIPIAIFSTTIAHFVQTVIARLDTVGIRDSALHALWNEVTHEKADPEAAAWRKREAMLGFEPDAAPQQVAETLQDLTITAGESAVDEIAAACANTDAGPLLNRIRAVAGSDLAIPGSLLPVLSHIDHSPARDFPPDTAPWDLGHGMARMARERLGLNADPISNRRLGELLALTEQDLAGSVAPMAEVPMGLAVRADNDGQVRFLFRRKHPVGRRFEASRWLADALLAPAKDRWLPATDAKTARQKMQRAFASEFLAPIGILQDLLGNDPTNEERIKDTARHFGVSSRMIHSHLANHDLVPFQK
ncbi:MAG: hypothetical protein HQL82_10020 [Magnetococcales bacterium]|nr:hypothetical protein [Magnetococcales bacterium]